MMKKGQLYMNIQLRIETWAKLKRLRAEKELRNKISYSDIIEDLLKK